MYYFIERFNPADVPFKGSDKALNLNGKVYDIVISVRNAKLEQISDFIISDMKTFDKSKSQFEETIKEFMKAEYNIDMNELLLG